MNALHFDPLDPETRRDPYPVYARLRREAPLFACSPAGPYVLSRYDDVHRALADPDVFSSAAFEDLIGRVDQLVVEQGLIDASEQWDERPETLLGSDPPIHTRLRKIVNRGFTRSRIAALEPRIRAIAVDLLDDFAEEGYCDFVADFAAPLPITVIAELLGVEVERRADFRAWSNALLVATTGGVLGSEQRQVAEAVNELSDYIDGLIEERRLQPREDLISALIAAEAREDVMTEKEVKVFTLLLLVAGNETTTNLLGNAMLAMLGDPGELERIAREPARIPPLVEEVLRYDSPVQLTLRRTTRPVEIAGGVIPDGATVLLLIGSANRDERRFARAERFKVGRCDQGHIAFGFGTHFCLGASLARLEARVALEMLSERLDRVELREPDPPRQASMLVRGPSRLRMAFKTRES